MKDGAPVDDDVVAPQRQQIDRSRILLILHAHPEGLTIAQIMVEYPGFHKDVYRYSLNALLAKGRVQRIRDTLPAEYRTARPPYIWRLPRVEHESQWLIDLIRDNPGSSSDRLCKLSGTHYRRMNRLLLELWRQGLIDRVRGPLTRVGSISEPWIYRLSPDDELEPDPAKRLAKRLATAQAKAMIRKAQAKK